jgi:hypothetical protein
MLPPGRGLSLLSVNLPSSRRNQFFCDERCPAVLLLPAAALDERDEVNSCATGDMWREWAASAPAPVDGSSSHQHERCHATHGCSTDASA